MQVRAGKNTGFRIEQIFGSKTRARLLSLFVHNPDQAYFVREISRKVGAQLNSVRRELKNLLGAGIVREVFVREKSLERPRRSLKKKYYEVDPSCVWYEDIRSLLKKLQLLVRGNFIEAIDREGSVELLLLTGRFVDQKKIPVDLLIVGTIPESVLQKILQGFEKEFGQEVNFTTLTKEEFLYRKDVSDKFLRSILDAEHLVMVNRLKEKF
jgi:DNA-binding transcriptional ArsR family regulator